MEEQNINEQNNGENAINLYAIFSNTLLIGRGLS